MPGVVPLIVVSVVAAALLVSTVVLAVKYNNQLLPDCPRCPPSSAKSFRSQTKSRRVVAAERECFEGKWSQLHRVRLPPGTRIVGAIVTFPSYLPTDPCADAPCRVHIHGSGFSIRGSVNATTGEQRVQFRDAIPPVGADGEVETELQTECDWYGSFPTCFDRLELEVTDP
jgi:hypothetical protein